MNMYWFEKKNCFVFLDRFYFFFYSANSYMREKSMQDCHIDCGHPPMKFLWQIEANVGGCKWSKQFFIHRCLSMIHFAAKISITQPYESQIAIVLFFFGQIMLLFVKNVFDEIEKGNVQKQKQKTTTHGIRNWIHRRKSFHITKT